VGLILAMLARLGLLGMVGWLVSLKQELFQLFGKGFTGKDLILLGGGLFLMYKASKEIYERVEHHHAPGEATVRAGRTASYAAVMAQVVLMDLVFSIDSVLTAVGMTKNLGIMYAGVIISVVVMVASAGWIARVLEQHPSLKILAISFLMLIGVVLMAEGWDHDHAIPKGYIYTAMGFSIAVELLNIWTGGRKAKAAGG
jgi:predicted tellurium resistance membrane protein TerC